MSTPIPIEGHVSPARLHGRACWHCGAVTRTLTAAGTVIRPGSTRHWPIVSCGCRPATSVRQQAVARRCAFCPEPDADACIRVQQDGRHVLAHRACAARKQVDTLYVFTLAPSRPDETP
ncbi:hypothetical protein ACGF1Z_31045 [Streptomyces sp. NPDC048018]|uniref:hypothetical protein n=1 Tax=Streptomyces sp. NPDC048018 TaxID=3365499 RepID=UPI00371F2AB6